MKQSCNKKENKKIKIYIYLKGKKLGKKKETEKRFNK